MAFERDPHSIGLEYAIGRLDGRVDALENRADTQEKTLIAMDGKLDDISRMLAQAAGGKDQMASLVKYGIALLASIGSIGGLIIAGVHWFVGKS